MLGPTFDYTHRLLDFDLATHDEARREVPVESGVRRVNDEPAPRVIKVSITKASSSPRCRTPSAAPWPTSPAAAHPGRDARLQNLARGDEGFLLALGYSTSAATGGTTPSRVRSAWARWRSSWFEELGFAITIAEITVTECQMVNQFKGSAVAPPSSPAATAWPSAAPSARRWPWPSWIARSGAARAPARPHRRRPRTRSSCSITVTTWRPRASSSTSSFRTTSISGGSWCCCGRSGPGRTTPPGGRISEYNLAFLDEQSKRMIRRAILKAVAIPGYQVRFGSREMPLSYGSGTGGVQVTASVIGPADVLKVIDQGADDTTNAVSIRQFFARTTGVRTTERTDEATLIQTRHRIPETPLSADQILILAGCRFRSRCAGSSPARPRPG